MSWGPLPSTHLAPVKPLRQQRNCGNVKAPRSLQREKLEKPVWRASRTNVPCTPLPLLVALTPGPPCPAAKAKDQGRKRPPPLWKPSFSFSGSEASVVFSLSGPMVFSPFPLCSQGDSIHHSSLCSATSGSGDRPREDRCHGGGAFFFS